MTLSRRERRTSAQKPASYHYQVSRLSLLFGVLIALGTIAVAAVGTGTPEALIEASENPTRVLLVGVLMLASMALLLVSLFEYITAKMRTAALLEKHLSARDAE